MDQKVISLVVMLILVSVQASAATVFGTVYDFSLTQTENVRVTINTVPRQQLIAVNGRYSFNAAPGEYTIHAEQLEFGKIVATADENITVGDEGSYVRDIILFPYFGEEEEILAEADVIEIEDLNRDQPETTSAIIVLLVLIVIILALILWRMKKLVWSIRHVVKGHKAEKKEEVKKDDALPKELQEIIDFIKSHENRVTQKDIRKKFPQSEAKISLLIADLEKRGVVEKIRKGRGNIIILKEK